MKAVALALFALIATSCGGGVSYDRSALMLEGLRTSVADAQRSQHTTTAELEILEERIDRYEREVGRAQSLEERVSELQARLQTIETKQTQAFSDIRSISKRTSMTEGTLAGMKAEISAQLADMRGALESVVALAKASQTTSYTVKSGDTLERIAGREGTSVTALMEANKLHSDRIIAGQKLIIP